MSESFINHLKKKYQPNQETVTLSVRVSVEENAAIYDLIDTVGCSKQDFLYELLKKYAFSEVEAMRKSDSALGDVTGKDDKRYHLLNTNKSNDLADHHFMLTEGVAAAFEDGYTHKIERIAKGDTVFLYESGVGIVAHGIATGEVIKAPHNGVKDKTFYQKLDNFIRLDKPLPAKRIRSVLGREVPFVQTLIQLRDGEKLLNEV